MKAVETAADFLPISKAMGLPGSFFGEWECPKCGTNHDRDLNAAKNMMAADARRVSLWSNCKTRRE